MKRIIALLLVFLLLMSTGCSGRGASAQIAATTLPVYEFTVRLCQGTDLSVTRLINESVSCLHDYSLNVGQVRAAEAAEVIVTSGAGLEDFLDDILRGNKSVIESGAGIQLLVCEHEHEHEHEHYHEDDPHIWLSPENAKLMAANIARGLSEKYPMHRDSFEANLALLFADLEALQRYGNEQLSSLSSRQLITFHDGFSYFAHSFDLTILKAVEEESGSEASATELRSLTELVRANDVPAVFTEVNGSTAAADIIAAETGVKRYALDMAMSGESYFTAMYHNIDTIKEALG